MLHSVICLEHNVYSLSYVPSIEAGTCFKPGVRASFRIVQRYCKAEGTSSHLAGVGTIVNFCFVGSHAKNLC